MKNAFKANIKVLQKICDAHHKDVANRKKESATSTFNKESTQKKQNADLKKIKNTKK